MQNIHSLLIFDSLAINIQVQCSYKNCIIARGKCNASSVSLYLCLSVKRKQNGCNR